MHSELKKRVIALFAMLTIMISAIHVPVIKADAKSQYVANVSIVSDGTSPGKGKSYGTHSFIYIENISKKNLDVMGLMIKPNQGVTVGTFGNRKDGKGIYLNLEGKLIQENGAYGKRVSLTRKVTQTELNKMLAVMKSSNKWSHVNNCAWFATKAWNTIASKNEKMSWSLIKNPAGLSKKIKKKDNFIYGIKTKVDTSKTFKINKNGKKIYTKGEVKAGSSSRSSSF